MKSLNQKSCFEPQGSLLLSARDRAMRAISQPHPKSSEALNQLPSVASALSAAATSCEDEPGSL